MHVLVVEDEVGIATFIKEGLEDEQFIVSTTLRGDQAIDMAMENTYDLILLDWMILGVSGIEVCQAIRQSSGEINKRPLFF